MNVNIVNCLQDKNSGQELAEKYFAACSMNIKLNDTNHIMIKVQTIESKVIIKEYC
jgi:hypothetical protein